MESWSLKKESLCARVSTEFMEKFREACKKVGYRRSDCIRLALGVFVKMILQGEYQEEEEEEGRKVVVNVQNLSIQPSLPIPEISGEALNQLIQILRAIANPATRYPPAWKQWAPVILNELEKLEKASRRKTNTIHI